MRGIVTAAGYVPYRRLRRAAVPELLGTGGGKGTRSVASHDEDTTTMGLEAARFALGSAPAAAPDVVWFSTPTPAYADKTNATAIHAALRMSADIGAFDFGGALRSGHGALMAALNGSGSTLLVTSDLRDGLPGGTDETFVGDAAAALLIAQDSPGAPVIAEVVGAASATDEFTDRWRSPGDKRSKVWEERFGETRYLDLAPDVWGRALKQAGIEADAVDTVVIASMHGRAAKSVTAKLGVKTDALADDLSASVGQTGGAHLGLLLAAALEKASPGEVIGIVSLADGADALVLRTTDAISSWNPLRTVAEQIANGAEVPYGKFLSWRGMLTPEPPRRPEPLRVQSPAAWRAEDWKYGFVGSKDRSSGAIHLPPSRISMRGGAVDDMEPISLAGTTGTIATFTVDRIAYSPSPPIVFAVVDFDGGARYPVELTDVDADALKMGDRVEMTFRRLYTADGIHDYFWKARPVRRAEQS
ncbi:MAG: OB-fold domain-containing protein [Acidimicrobiales bacterium]